MKRLAVIFQLQIILFAAAVCAISGLATGSMDIYVSPKGSDTAVGSKDAPFATIPRAMEQVRSIRSAGPQEDVNVILRNGKYYLPDGLVFGPDDGGDANYAVTYRSYPGELAVLVGGVKISGWEKGENGIWEVAIPERYNPKQIFDNRQRLPLARQPNEDYMKIAGPEEKKPSQGFFYQEGDIQPGKWDLSDARIFIWQGEFWSSHWFSMDKKVERVNAAERLLRMDGDQGYPMTAGNEYYLYNVPELIDIEGEAVLSHSRGMIYMKPLDAGFVRREITVSTAKNTIRLMGTPQNMVRNLHFEGLDITIANEEAVWLENTADCSIRFSRIENAGMSGVKAALKNERIELYGNEITENGYCGVELAGGGFTVNYISHHHRIVNNHIHHCGRLVGHGCGVYITQSGDNEVLHNEIHHMPRYGTAINGVRYQVLKQQVKEMNWENHYDYLHSRRNRLAYNHIHHVNLKTQDTGAMESWGPGRDNVYDHNLIHDVGNSRFSIQSGIYGDDATDYFLVTNNVIYNVYGMGSQPILFKGIGSIIRNNVLIVSAQNCSAIRSIEMGDERNDSLVYSHNIIYYEPSNIPLQDYGLRHAWEIDVSKPGRYAVWAEYSTGHYWSGRDPKMLDHITTISVDGAEPETVKFGIGDLDFEQLSWDQFRWVKVLEQNLDAGKHSLSWHNPLGGGINLKCFAVGPSSDWTPQDDLVSNTKNRQVYIEHANLVPGDYRSIYEITNGLENRVSISDHNIYWKHGDAFFVWGNGKRLPYHEWTRLHGGKYDTNSLVADPMFVNPAQHDYRLRAQSPARKIGIEQIDVSAIGLLKDYPSRLK